MNFPDDRYSRRKFVITSAKLIVGGALLESCSGLSVSHSAHSVKIELKDYPNLEYVGAAVELVINGTKVIALRLSENQISVVSRRCTHRGCSVGYNGGSQRFECPCHGSSYATDGRVLGGPATQALERYEVVFNPSENYFRVAI